ncbi:MAG: HAD family phosphatase [Treponemataceae bacterium]|nr:HAD family phosphatase [Treponemataceae bacterium]
MIKGLIFDADGTLIDSMKYWMQLTPSFLSQKGKKSNKELERKIFSMSLEEGCILLKKEFSFEESSDQIKKEILAIIDEFYRKVVPLKNGVKEFLEEMKKRNLPMIIATAGNEELIKASLERLNCLNYFERIITCGKLSTDKSSPEIFNHAAQILKLKPEEILVFEDALIPVRTAKNANFKVIAIKDEFSLEDKEEIQKTADLYVQDFTSKEILKLL